MKRPNYGFEKRQRENQKRAKLEAKRQKKAAARNPDSNAVEGGADGVEPDSERSPRRE